jgi:virulence factor Mce-like protein
VNKDPLSASRVLVIAGFTLSCFGLLMFLWLAFGGAVPLKPKGYRLKISFTDAPTLAEQADVRVAGVNIGKVVAKERDPKGNRTIATLEIDRKYAPIRRDARALLRQKTLLGETYVEMTMGRPTTGTVPENGRLANARVADAVEFDEFFRIFGQRTRRDFRQWQKSSAQASRGRATDISDALGTFPGFFETGEDLLTVLNRRREGLQSLVRNTGTTFEAISRNEDALQNAIVRNRQVFETLADRRDALAESFQIFPTFQREARATMGRLGTFSQDTEPLLRDLEPVLEDAQPTLASLRRLSPSAQRLFGDLDPLIGAGREGFPALGRVLRGLDPTLASFTPFLNQLTPILQYLELHQPTVSDFLNQGPAAIGGIRPAPANSGTNGHVLPQLIITGDQSFPQAERSQTNRGNAYFRPGWLDFKDFKQPDHRIFPNWDCRHVGERAPAEEEGNPGCFTQGPIPFQGRVTRFPQIREGESR